MIFLFRSGHMRRTSSTLCRRVGRRIERGQWSFSYKLLLMLSWVGRVWIRTRSEAEEPIFVQSLAMATATATKRVECAFRQLAMRKQKKQSFYVFRFVARSVCFFVAFYYFPFETGVHLFIVSEWGSHELLKFTSLWWHLMGNGCKFKFSNFSITVFAFCFRLVDLNGNSMENCEQQKWEKKSVNLVSGTRISQWYHACIDAMHFKFVRVHCATVIWTCSEETKKQTNEFQTSGKARNYN